MKEESQRANERFFSFRFKIDDILCTKFKFQIKYGVRYTYSTTNYAACSKRASAS